MLDHRFGSGPTYTLGVEEEYMLLDPISLDLAPRIDALIAAAQRGALAERIKPELLQSVVEIATPPCAGPAELAVVLRDHRRAVSELSSASGCRFASAGTHPFARFEEQAITAEQRYEAMVDEFQLVARQQVIFGLHFHAAVRDAETSIRVVEGLVPHLCELLALSASSPFWRGQQTGLQSSRQMVFAALPRSGVPPPLAGYEEFAELVATLERGGVIPDYTRLWWDVRPHPRFGTVELRVCDAVTRLEDVVALAAYYQALVKLLCERESGTSIGTVGRVVAAENKWLAARHGLEAAVVDPNGGGSRVPLSALIRHTLRELEPHARELGCDRELAGIEEILEHGNGSSEQLRAFRAGNDLRSIVAELARRSDPR